ncbi:hypothetical protein COT47_01980 [Candidatus Woesearchaeota archaeon CG08_land_8_20_14_0_20_43_7]|nr:MAG: hypothetical protein COT47_01980 [Candidatus Woesearchaeota archaeon CG08_land_8_20_14_0_20_43_7]
MRLIGEFISGIDDLITGMTDIMNRFIERGFARLRREIIYSIVLSILTILSLVSMLVGFVLFLTRFLPLDVVMGGFGVIIFILALIMGFGKGKQRQSRM